MERNDHLDDLGVDGKLTLRDVNTYVYVVRVWCLFMTINTGNLMNAVQTDGVSD
jgi:hypothetical protein